MEIDVPTETDRRTASGQSGESIISIDLQQRCAALLSQLDIEPTNPPQASGSIAIPAVVYDYAISRAEQSPSELLDALSLLTAVDGPSDVVVRTFEPVLLDICARWMDGGLPNPQSQEAYLCALASIALLRPDLWSLIYNFLLQSPYRQTPLVGLAGETESKRIHSLLLAYLRLLNADPRLAERLRWSASPLYRLRQHPDAGVRLLAVQVLSKQQSLSEARRMELEAEWVGRVDEVDAQVLYGHEAVLADGALAVKEVWVDGWLLPVHEARRLENYGKREMIVDTAPTTVDGTQTSRHTAILGGRPLLRATAGKQSDIEPFVHVPTSSANTALSQVSPLFQLGLPVLISSPPSSGKTHLVQHLSTQLYPGLHPTHRILTIPLADTSIDVKSLIGTYISSTTKPGTFEWMEGALTKAVRAGRWVVFDDIDRASTEMLVTIAGITRSLRPGRPGRRAELPIPGRTSVEAGDGFALFATRSTSLDAFTPAAFIGHQEFRDVVLESPNDSDIYAILSARFATLPEAIITPLVAIWQKLRPLAKISGQVKARSIGLRDLEKWCDRIAKSMPASGSSSAGPFANPAFQDEIMLEAADIFIASLDTKLSSQDKRVKMVGVIAEGIEMDEERALSLLERRKPALELAPSSRQLIIGRTVLPTAPAEKRRAIANPSARPFALTKPSLILLERVAAAINTAEPLLLVGETGTGKTTAVQYIADTCRKPLTALNLSMQTESSDLLGGFKPIDASVAARSLHAKWQKLFCESFSMGKSTNGAYIEAAAKSLSGRKWARCAELWSTSAKRAIDKLSKPEQPAEKGSDSPRKRRKLVNTKAVKLAVQWQSLLVEVADFDLHHVKMKSKLVFSFVEGPLVKALTSGEWILLDEVNLASQETLEAISTILEGASSSLVLTERGDVEPIQRHPDFRLFACMNPATDVGKKDLPPNLRNRFTELYVPPPDDDREALITIVSQYIGDAAAGDRAVVLDVVEMYSTLKHLSAAKEIVDGSNTAPHFSMRTLARALVFALDTAPLFGLRRALWEGCLMAFTMSLDLSSAKRAHEVCERHLLTPMKNARAVLGQIPALPASADADDYVRFGPFWLRRGPLPPDTNESRYVITASVQSKLSDLARVILTHRYPVLIQGPTSAGKTSAVEFLARQTGHRFVRINNHEHTDIQEYLGTYVTDPKTGNLVFQEGLLVTAVRQGHWIVLDELNLAPTDVLEALNRLLDDNRELVIPETQEVIRPHPNFILFATQNPPGLYAGRKVLSRAFRNRFLEVHFDDVPKDELETILCQRCQIAPPYAKKIVQVFEELRHRRQASRVFESKSSFATLRDLFRWAERGAIGYEQLAEDGYMLLAERARQDEDKVVIKQVIEDVLKVKVDEHKIYRVIDSPVDSILARLPFDAMPASTLVWTRAMQRLFALVAFALAHNEPVLLVGETGCGKTSVCEVIAEAFNQRLVGVNCHQNMETADLLGSQRPVRNRHDRKAKILQTLAPWVSLAPTASDDDLAEACKEALRLGADTAIITACKLELQALNALFEWSDGPLVHAMQAGDLLLLDEVSLADDSVLERLNSVLEPGRTLVLAEKGGTDIDEATLHAHDSFHVVATMNPGGDFGKKELSPALRNRFTEIWVPPLDDRQDLLQIIGSSWKHDDLRVCGEKMLDFFGWFGQRIGDSAGMGLRDILAWVKFSDTIYGGISVGDAFHHGGQTVVVDGLESLSQVGGQSAATVGALRRECLEQLDGLAALLGGHANSNDLSVTMDPSVISIGGFGIARGQNTSTDSSFRFEAPTTALNAMRVLRGCQLPKAILLEGSPGVGKTSLVSALAAVAGHRLQRINLSDQTDLIDLFGSDLPVEGGQAGEFQWRDAAFLDAMQKGDWVLLDEMNLASQTVLEGLNAVLDHRGTVFIPELGRSFDRHPGFRVFAAQNPLQQGGGRKGLPKSFLNRFTKVYLQEHTPDDLLMICRHLYPADIEMVQRMISFNEIIRDATMVSRTIGREGSPWEFNLRDLFRWFTLLAKTNGLEMTAHPVEYLKLVYTQRFRNERDRNAVIKAFQQVFDEPTDFPRPQAIVTPNWFQLGHSLVARGSHTSVDLAIRHGHLDLAESILKCIEHGWLVILSGESGSGKHSLLQAIAAGAGRQLGEFAMHPGVDTSEMLGSFEQQDIGRLVSDAYAKTVAAVQDNAVADAGLSDALEQLRSLSEASISGPSDATIQAFSHAARNVLAGRPHTEMALSALDHLEQTGTEATGFAWIDGQLLTAIREGGWFLLSNANLCSASVLDRLNSLCESNGVLVLSEKGSATGSPEVITPHPEFRLFMTYDPRHGELSRAMRNRGVELCVEKCDSNVFAQPTILADHALLRSVHFMNVDGTSASRLANTIAGQPALAMQLLDRYGKSTQHGDLYEAALGYITSVVPSSATGSARDAVAELTPIDPCTNPNIQPSGNYTVFRATQLLLRNTSSMQDLQDWVVQPENSKSVLAASSRVGKGRSRVKIAGSEIWPVISGIRQVVKDNLANLVTLDAENSATIEQLEQLSVLLVLLASRNSGVVFDYSSTQLLAKWIDEAIPAVPAFQAISAAVSSLGQSLALTTGLGQAQVWSMFREGAATLHLDAHLLDQVSRIEDSRLRLSVVQAIASAQRDNADTSALETLLQSLIPATPQLGSTTTTWRNAAVLGALELETLRHDADQVSIDLLTSSREVPLQQVARLHSLDSPASFFGAVTAFMYRLWTDINMDDQDQINRGPADLFQPTRLASVLRFGGAEPVKLADLPEEQRSFRFTVDLILANAKQPNNVRAGLESLACQVLGKLAVAFGVPMPESISLSATLDALVSADTPLGHTLGGLRPHTDGIAGIAEFWLGLSRAMIDLYVTNIPIDPAVRRVLLGDVLAARMANLEEELEAVEQSELITKGVCDSLRSRSLKDRIVEMQSQGAGLGPSIDRGTDAGRLATLFSEIHAFLDDAFSSSAVQGLMSTLSSGHQQAAERERGFQLSAAAFVQRLTSNYQDLQDLAAPVITAVGFARFGIRLLARDLVLRNAPAAPSVVAATQFPLSAVVSDFTSTDHRVTDKAGLRDQFLAAIALAQTPKADQRLVETLGVLYESWSNIRSREQQDEQASESLYRVKKTEIEVLSDQEQEEKEFAELFPSYEEDDEEQVVKPAQEVDDKLRFDSESVLAFHQLVMATAKQDDADVSLQTAIDKLLRTDFDPATLDESADLHSLPLQIRYLATRSRSLQPASTHPNFYLEANEPEVRKAHGLIMRLIARLDQLIEDWPDQMVPQHIKDRCVAVLALHTRSPVAKVLTSLEQLLLHTNDWEGYANKENSLAVHQTELTNLIIEWRRLELSSWMRLLDDQVKEYVDNDAEWTLRLFGALIQSVSTVTDVAKHLETTLPMILSYLSTSSLGHFGARVDTLKALGQLSLQLDGEAHAQTSVLLHNIVANSSLFLPRILVSLRTQRAIIDKAIKDFVKLASWKDVNVYALKASAVKSHRQLHRNVRKFREVLRQPVAPILMDHNSLCPQEQAALSSLGTPAPLFDITAVVPAVMAAREGAAPATPAHLARLPDIQKRYHSIHDQTRAAITTHAGDALDGMTVDIIETAAALAKATPANLTKDNTKLVNNLASRKRKAYSDLLKSLRASGFSNSVRADQLAKQQSPTWISALPALPQLPNDVDSGSIDKIENYHHRLNVLMITLRAAFNGHNPDIASQDLERGIGFAESVFASALVERQRIVADLERLTRLVHLTRRLERCASSEKLGPRPLQQRFVQAEADLTQLAAVVDEVLEGLSHFAILDPGSRFDDAIKLHGFKSGITTCLKAVAGVIENVRASGVAIFTSDELELLAQVSTLQASLKTAFSQWSDSHVQLRHLFVPVSAMLQTLGGGHIDVDPINMSTEAWSQSDDVIQSMLVVTQSLRTEPVERNDDDPTHFPTEYKALNATTASLQTSGVLAKLDSFIDHAADSPDPMVLARMLPFVSDLAETYARSVRTRAYTVKSNYKLAYVLARVVFDLAQKGFCKPQEESNDKGDGDDGAAVDGTGMGAGTGDKNVSKEIEEESQVEGLQGEQEEEQDGGQDREDEDDAVSMDDDFEGQLGDAKEGEDDGKGSDDGDEEERDDHVGDVDPLDPGAVDEKFWGDDEKEQEQQENEGKEDLMNQKDEGGGESEMAAKESEGNKGKDKDKEQEQPEGQQDNNDDNEHNDLDDFDDKNDQNEDGEEKEGEEDKMEDGPEQDGGIQDQDDVAAPEGDRLDLPDDLDIGDDEQGEGADAEDFDDLHLDGQDEDQGPPEESSDAGQANEDDGAEGEDDAPAPTGATEEEANEPDDTLNPNVDTSAAADNQAQQSAEAGAGLDGGQQDGQDRQQQQQDEQEDVEMEAEGEGPAKEQQGASTAEQDQGDGPVDSAGAPVSSGANDRSDRSLGDILQEIQRRRDEILAQQERENETSDPAAPDEVPGQVEYLHQGDQDEGLQALGAAGEEKRQKLEDLNIVDEEERDAADAADPAMDYTEDVEGAPPPARTSDATVKTEADVDRQATEKALTQSDVRGQGAEGANGDMDVDPEVLDEEVPAAPPSVKEEEDIEIEIKEGEGVVSTNTNGEDIWRQYASLTSDLSYALCEQLRLILEPTMATRLQGDFRTGKRLNMRKIIPYIASEYTKDKIWLRRTKPSRREYQVLLSLDDSRSMAESHSVHLAYQTLALVSQALNKLEVGQISIARFGESVDILHPFGDTGFTDADGAKVMDSFKFDQHKTDVAALVERSLSFLADARQRQASSASAPDLWQLQVIISDGVCQDHHKLRTLLRRALEERVMIVFVIVDSLHQSSSTPAAGTGAAAAGRPSSILSMQTVEYKEVNGAMQLDMKRYLDTFPFEFYVVLRDVEALPGVLADTLRQWMARVSQSNE